VRCGEHCAAADILLDASGRRNAIRENLQFPIFRCPLLVFILLLTGALILSLVRIPNWYGQLAVHGIPSPSDLTWRVGLIGILHFLCPLALLYVALKLPYWIILSLYQPDLILWLESVAAVVFVKGVLQIALAWRVFSQSH
jgi:hypothetical protein